MEKLTKDNNRIEMSDIDIKVTEKAAKTIEWLREEEGLQAKKVMLCEAYTALAGYLLESATEDLSPLWALREYANLVEELAKGE